MAKKLTIMIDDEVYDGLEKAVGSNRIGRFLNELARSHVRRTELDADYEAMAADETREVEAHEWIEGLVQDIADDPR
jgi:hypothetical protein